MLVVTVALPSQCWGISLLHPEQGWLAVVLGGHSSGTGKNLDLKPAVGHGSLSDLLSVSASRNCSMEVGQAKHDLSCTLSWPQGERTKIQLQV